jgi:hypothetical protein
MTLKLDRMPPFEQRFADFGAFLKAYLTWYVQFMAWWQKSAEAIEGQEDTQDAILANLQTTDATLTTAQADLSAVQSQQAQILVDLGDTVDAVVAAQADADTANAAATGLDTRVTSLEGATGNYVIKNQTVVWALPTGTLTRSGFSTYTGTASAGYVQSELQGVMDKLKTVSEHVAALISDGRSVDLLTE